VASSVSGFLTEQAERPSIGKRGQAFELLASSAFQVGAKQNGMARLVLEGVVQPFDVFCVAAKNHEDARVELAQTTQAFGQALSFIKTQSRGN
jgi:hypothetical protein